MLEIRVAKHGPILATDDTDESTVWDQLLLAQILEPLPVVATRFNVLDLHVGNFENNFLSDCFTLGYHIVVDNAFEPLP